MSKDSSLLGLADGVFSPASFEHCLQIAVSYSTPHPEGIVKSFQHTQHTIAGMVVFVLAVWLACLSVCLYFESLCVHIELFRWRLVQGEIAPLAVFTILGSASPPQEVSIYCIGISVSPTQLSWGCGLCSPKAPKRSCFLTSHSYRPSLWYTPCFPCILPW